MKQADHIRFMRRALRLAARGYGNTSPNPMVGAVLVKAGRILGLGWHKRAGEPHAEIEAIRDAQSKARRIQGASLYVTLEPCSTHGRTPPCTQSIIAAGVKHVIAAATDPNPAHRGRGFRRLEQAGIRVTRGILAEEAARLNESFNHWIVHRTPFVTVKAAMTLDGKIATRTGESKWITGPRARAWSMKQRQGVDAILVGVNTVLADNPALTFRSSRKRATPKRSRPLRRIILDSDARTPLAAQVVADELSGATTLVVSRSAPKRRVAKLASRVTVWLAPVQRGAIDLRWVLKKLGAEGVTNLLVEGGGEVNASFLLEGFAHRVAFFYAPKVVGGAHAPKAVAGDGIRFPGEVLDLRDVQWRKLGNDLLLTARLK